MSEYGGCLEQNIAENRKLHSHLIYFSRLMNFHSQLTTITLISLNSQHSYKHFIVNRKDTDLLSSI